MAKFTHRIKTVIDTPSVIPWLLGHRLTTAISYKGASIVNDWAFPPETINIYLTMRCNLRCAMCFEKFYKTEIELELIEWHKIIKELKNFRPRIHLSGGEPFLYKGIGPLIAYIKINKLFLHITTNGTNLAEYAKDIVKMKINQIDISIDGIGEMHDKIRGVAGTFNQILAGLEKIKKLKYNRKLPVLKINSIINFENSAAVNELIKFGRDFGIDSIQFLHPLFLDSAAIEQHRKYLMQTIGRDVKYWQKANFFKPNLPNFDKTKELTNRFLRTPQSIKIEIIPQFNIQQLKAYYNSSTYFYELYPGKCRAMWNTATILPDGNVESCPDYFVGNCLKEKFLNIWNNKPMRSLRRRIRDRKFFSVCRACCFYYG